MKLFVVYLHHQVKDDLEVVQINNIYRLKIYLLLSINHLQIVLLVPN